MTALTVLEDGWVFTQSGPWTGSDLVGAARDRGYLLREEQLGVLYRAGLLTPFAAIHDDPVGEPLRRTVFPDRGSSSDRRELAAAATEGRISDPGVDPLPPGWSFGPSHLVESEARWWNGLLYSPWQVLEFAVIVATDPEGQMSDASKFKSDLTREIQNGLHRQGADDAHPNEIDALVSVTSWDSAFEFSHFTDEELVDALKQLPNPGLPDNVDPLTHVATARQNGWSLTKGAGRLSKTRLAEALWPALSRKIDTALNSGGPMPPLAQVVIDAHQIAASSRPLEFGIARQAPPESDE